MDLIAWWCSMLVLGLPLYPASATTKFCDKLIYCFQLWFLIFQMGRHYQQLQELEQLWNEASDFAVSSPWASSLFSPSLLPCTKCVPQTSRGGGREIDLNRLQLGSTASQTLGLGPSLVDLTSPPRDSGAIKYGSRVLAKSLVFLFQLCNCMIKKAFPGFVLPTQHI